jgi:Arc/MetJ-type ribon-helix-helix transcriptional regulator
MIPVQIRFTKKIIERIDKLIESGVYSSRSAAIRDATRRLVLGLSSIEELKIEDLNSSFKMVDRPMDRPIERPNREVNGR